MRHRAGREAGETGGQEERGHSRAVRMDVPGGHCHGDELSLAQTSSPARLGAPDPLDPNTTMVDAQGRTLRP